MWYTSSLILILTLAMSSASGHKALSSANNHLAFQLHHFLAPEVKGNILVSPFSVSATMAMLMLGASGDTENELYRVLGYQNSGLSKREVHSVYRDLLDSVNDAAKEYVLYLVNALISQKGFPVEENYKCDLKSLYQAMLKEVDFTMDETVEAINQWVSNATKKNIEKVVDSFDPDTVLVFLSAVYFKGTWKHQFDPSLTKYVAFLNHGKSSLQKQVPMMRNEGHFQYGRLDEAGAVELPYVGDDIRMVILLPDEYDGIAVLESSLTPNTIADLRESMFEMHVEVHLPRFRIQYRKELSGVLKKLGITEIFDVGADLDRINPSGTTKVSGIHHKAVFEVNETGSEAAGITDVGITDRSGPFEFRVDHPFLFYIVEDRTDLILFQGRVSEL